MFPLLLLAFILVPIAELAVIIEVGGVLGVWPTIVILVVDSVAGAVLVKREGRRAWEDFRTALSEARWPGDEVTQGGLILVGGALLLTPGFLTDAVGLLAVLPPTRSLASRLIRRRLTPAPFRDRRDRSQGRTIDVEVVSVERDEPDRADGGGHRADGRGDGADGRGDGADGRGDGADGGGDSRSGQDELSGDDPSGRGTSGGRAP